MSRRSYFSQYVSPNIVIVPTVSFAPPESHVEPDPITSPLNYEQTKPKDYNSDPVPSETFLHKDNVTSVDMNFSQKAIKSTRASDNYVSPNIVIVPTVSFAPPESHVEPDPITSPLNYEQTKPKDYNSDPVPSETFLHKDNVTSVDMNFSQKAIKSTRASDNIRISPIKTQSTIATNVPSYHTSPRIKELPAAQYKSRNSLVDFTGFNRLKWDRGNPSSKYRDPRRDSNYISDTMKDNKETEYRKSSEKYTRKSDTVVDKEPSKSIKPTSSQSKRKAENIGKNDIKQIESEMTEKMKKCFKQLWKRNVEKLRAKSAKEKLDKLKHSKEHSKSLKPETVRSKPHLQGVTKNTTSKNIRNKTIEKAKKDYDFERSTSAKPKRSKSVSNATLSADSDETKGRKAYLSPVSMKRYKDFQKFIRQNKVDSDDEDNESKAKYNQKKKTDQVYKKKISMKSCETITKTKSDTKTKLIERKEVIKKETTKKERHTEVTNTTQNKKERVKPIKSVVQVNKPSQGRFANVEEDLRLKLSRKRTKSQCETKSTQQSGNSKTDQEKEKIRLKQDAKADTKISKVDKPKKNKKMKLIIINIQCPDSDDSEDSERNSNESSRSPQDLSFLDDINVDEIVDSLNDGQIQIEQNVNKQNSAANTMYLIKDKTNEYDHRNTCNEDTGIEDSINIVDKKTTKIKREKNKSCEDVIIIDSDSGDGDLKIKSGSSAKENLEKEQAMKTSSQINKNMKRTSTKITGPTIKQIEKDVQLNMGRDETKSSVSETIIIGDANKNSEHSSVAKNVKEFKSNQNESKVDQILELLTRSTKKRLASEITKKSQSTASTSGIKKSKSLYKRRNADRENSIVRNHTERKFDDNDKLNSLEKAATEGKTDLLSGDPIEASLVTIFSPIKQNNMYDVTAQHVLYAGKNIKTENMQVHNSSDPVEASLETMFNGKKEKVIGKQIHNEPFNSDKKIKDNLHNSNNSEEASLSNTFSDNKQAAVINRVTEESNLAEKDIQNETFDNMGHMIDLNANIKAEIKNVDRVKRIPKTAENNILQKPTQTNSDPPSRANVGKSTQNVVIKLQKSDEKVKASNAHTKTFKQTQRTPAKGIENKTNPVVKPPENNNKTTGKSTPNEKNIVLKKSTSHVVKPQSNPNQNNKPKELAKPKESIKKPHEISSKNCGKSVVKTDVKPMDKREMLKNNTKESGQASNQQKTADNAAKDEGLTSTNKKDTKGDVKHLQKPINKECHDTTIQCEKNKPSKIKDTQLQNKAEINVTNKPDNLKKTTSDIKPGEKRINATKEIQLAEKPCDKASSESEANNSDVNKTVASSNNIEQDTKKKSELIVSNTKTKESTPPNGQDLTQKPREELKNNIQTKNHNTAHAPLLKNDNTNKGNPPCTSTADEKTNKDQTTKTSAKPAMADSKNKSLETDKNDTQKPGTSNDSSKVSSTAMKAPNKTNEVIKLAENVANSNKKESDAKLNKVAEDRQKKDDKGNKVEIKIDIKIKSGFEVNVESALSHNLQTQAELVSKIHNGRFSAIHKCSDSYGNTYALKIMKVASYDIGQQIESMLFGLQENYSTDRRPSILPLICSFEVQNQYCLLTEFYPKNLVQALKENKRGFHINLVQLLSKQLVDAMNMLSDHNIVHSDLKPGHILLNSTNDKLKLCGFERSGYYDSIKIYPSTGTSNYRAPEIILGFPEYQRIDVWSAALIMFKMATNTELFSGIYNNEILYQHLCTLGSFDWTMIEESKFNYYYFVDTSFKLKTGPGRNDVMLVPVFPESDRLRRQLFSRYTTDWSRSRTRWQMTNDLDKLETLHSLLEQMLDLDPRHRLPVQFVAVSEFLNNFSNRTF
uniref:Protein kinase domain-containing protein n=1 Tax=Heliothis virescens TaxID=7102 RepID=A0A2A4J4M3_HELVI